MKAEQQRIEKELVTFENKLWGIEEPDTTTTVNTDEKAEKKSVRSTARKPRAKASEKKTENTDKKTSVRTTRQRTTSSAKSSDSGQTLSVRRQRR